MIQSKRSGAIVWTLALAALTSACASTRTRPAAPRPFPVPGAASAPAPARPRLEPLPPDPAALPDVGAAIPPSALPPSRSEVQVFDSYALVGTALSLRGIPYRNGGTDPEGFDCSGFTQYVFAKYGIAIPRDVRSQYRFGKPIEPEEISPGDLVFFATTDPGASHVAIAIGGNGFVHAPSTWGAVRVEFLSGTYWSRRFLGARRMTFELAPF
jgi:cell wall-associated NlpC family hydrolase